MRFDLVTPCKNCPFRTDIKPYLREKRATEIAESIIYRDATFSCHNTNSFNGEGETIETKDSQHCAGALIFLEKDNNPNQMMRIAELLGLYDRRKLDMEAPVFGDKVSFSSSQPK